MTYLKLRVEQETDPPTQDATPVADQRTDDLGVEHWRGLAVATAERLTYAETQLKDLRKAADENRARMMKAKQRQESAQQRVNELQAQVVRLTAEVETLRVKASEVDGLREQITDQAEIKRRIWELFAEL